MSAGAQPRSARVRIAVGPGGRAAASYAVTPPSAATPRSARRRCAPQRLGDRRALGGGADRADRPGLSRPARRAAPVDVPVRSRQVALEKRRRASAARGRDFESLRDYRPATSRATSAGRRRRGAGSRSRASISRSAARRSGFWSTRGGCCAPGPATDQARSRGQRGARARAGRAWRRATASGCSPTAGAPARVAPGRGAAHLRAIVEALAQVRAEAVEADHAAAAAALLRRRSGAR